MDIIAEVGSTWRLPSWEDSRQLAIRAVHEAADAGATIVKVQIFRAVSLYSQARAPELYARAKEYELPLDWLPELRVNAKKAGVRLWASIFAVDLIEPALPYLDGLKVASGDFTNRELTIAMAKAAERARISLAFSTGAATAEEVTQTVHNHLFYAFPKDLILMHCVSSYPARNDEMNLRALTRYNKPDWYWINRWGLSDHTEDELAAQLALALGYTVFEKHFMPTGADMTNPDAVVALSPARFNKYVESLRYAEAILGTGKKEVQESEASERIWARRGKDGLRPAND